MIKFTVKDTQATKTAIRNKLAEMMNTKTVLVGIHEEAGNTADGDLTMAQLGATLNFGTDIAGKNHNITIPARPWLAEGVQSGNADYMAIIENHSDNLDHALEMIGNIAVGKVQEYMTNLQDPPNADSTIRRKGSSNPLIDTGALRQSVTYSITNVKPEEGLG